VKKASVLQAELEAKLDPEVLEKIRGLGKQFKEKVDG
jgi:hypothetical protein